MKFAVLKNGNNSFRDKMTDELVEVCLDQGYEISSDIDDVNFVLNLTSLEHLRAFRRKSKSVFVISILSGENSNGSMRAECYTALIKTLSNLLIYAVNDKSENFDVYFTTPEAGFYNLKYDPLEVFKRILPIANSHFATDNILIPDLPKKYWNGSPIVDQIKHYGRELDNMGVLPVPFPLREVLPEKDMRHLYKIFGITGASYGNLSARERIEELGNSTFWMTGRGINKSNITKVGKDVMLVKDFDYKTGTALLSMPEDFDPKSRVSVDAVEHSKIYKLFPEVGAIVHVHAWMDGVLCTHQNHPCGTVELADEVVELLSQTDNPAQSTVGLKNHGLTITGRSLDEIFNRIRGNLKTEVPMFA